jgi:glycyl-radical enzyme activating protein family
MKGILFDIKRFAVHDGSGIRTTVFMKGCPLACDWCHNPESMDTKICVVRKNVKIGNKIFTEDETVGYEITSDQLWDELKKDRIFMEESGGGVTFSGGEPLMQPKFLKEMLIVCKREEIHTAVDTSGFASWATLRELLPYIDLFLYDLKIMDEKLHKVHTGVSNKLVLENLTRLLNERKKVRIRIPMIPGISFTSENIRQSIDYLKKLPDCIEGVDLLPYHNTAIHKYERFRFSNKLEKMGSLAKEELVNVKQQFELAGFRTNIGG